MNKLKVLDLFSGIGGFSLGLERTGGFETVAFCEIDEHAKRVLKKNWDKIPIYEDVKDFKHDGAIDAITGGFPCQDMSQCGKKLGIEDGARSGLWKFMFEAIGRYKPKYVIIENVPGLITGESGRWFAKLLSDLAFIGYDAQWHCISIADVGGGVNAVESGLLPTPIKTDGFVLKKFTIQSHFKSVRSGHQDRFWPYLLIISKFRLKRFIQIIENLMGYPMSWTELND